MQGNEVTRLFILHAHQPVIFRCVGRIETAVGKASHQAADAALDQVDAGRFQGFDKARGKTQSQAILVKEFPPAAGCESERPWLTKRPAFKTAHQRGGRLVVGYVTAAIDIAVAGSMLQGNAPLPTGFTCGGARERFQGTVALAGYRHGPVAGQPVAPVLIAGLQGILNQKTAKPRAIDEEIGCQALAIGQRDSLDEPVFASKMHRDDLAFDPPDPTRLGAPPQERRVKRRVEVIGIGKAGCRISRVPGILGRASLPSRDRVRRIFGQFGFVALPAAAQPEMVKGHHVDRHADRAERMEIAVPDSLPVRKFDAQLDGGVGFTEELLLVYPKPAVEGHNRRDGGFTHANCADLLGLD